VAAEVAIHVSVAWTEPEHYDAQRELPCEECGVPTRLRTRHDVPCHPACFQQACERELLGRARQLLADERLPGRHTERIGGSTDSVPGRHAVLVTDPWPGAVAVAERAGRTGLLDESEGAQR
jgi:hypothetical protein